MGIELCIKMNLQQLKGLSFFLFLSFFLSFINYFRINVEQLTGTLR